VQNKIFSFWKNCLLKPPNDKGKEAVLYVGSFSITLTFLHLTKIFIAFGFWIKKLIAKIKLIYAPV